MGAFAHPKYRQANRVMRVVILDIRPWHTVLFISIASTCISFLLYLPGIYLNIHCFYLFHKTNAMVPHHRWIPSWKVAFTPSPGFPVSVPPPLDTATMQGCRHMRRPNPYKKYGPAGASMFSFGSCLLGHIGGTSLSTPSYMSGLSFLF